MGGLHIISEYFSCENKELLKDKTTLQKEMEEIVSTSGLKTVGALFHQFGGEGGVTGVIVLAESHVSIHTWPERDGFVNTDVFVCNVTQDNTEKAREVNRKLRELLKPGNDETQEVMRK